MFSPTKKKRDEEAREMFPGERGASYREVKEVSACVSAHICNHTFQRWKVTQEDQVLKAVLGSTVSLRTFWDTHMCTCTCIHMNMYKYHITHT